MSQLGVGACESVRTIPQLPFSDCKPVFIPDDWHEQSLSGHTLSQVKLSKIGITHIFGTNHDSLLEKDVPLFLYWVLLKDVLPVFTSLVKPLR